MHQPFPAFRPVLQAILAIALTTTGLHAAPYGPEGLPIEWTQPDGTRLSLRVFGDEFYARTETLDGHTVVYNAAGKAYEYAKLAPNGRDLVSSGVKANGKVPPGLAKKLELPAESRRAIWKERYEKLAPDERANWAKRVKAARDRKGIDAGEPGPQNDPDAGGGSQPAPLAFAPVTGAYVGLTILVQFPDDPATTPAVDPTNFPTTKAAMENYCNQIGYTGGGNTGSVRDYFLAQSLNQTDYTQVVTEIVTLPQPRAYYNWSNYPTNTTLRDGGLTGRLVLNDAITILKAQNFDFTGLTRDGSNRVVATNVLFAGATSGVWPDGLWPHRWSLSPQVNVGTTQNPIYIYDYQITNAQTSSVPIGTFCHENGHLLLKYPDLYDYGGESEGVGNHCLMGGGNHLNGGKTPGPINGYFKDISGWSNVVDITTSQFFTDSLPTTGNEGYRIRKPGTPTEYFLIENRGTGDPWAQYSPDKGILIWHIDENVSGNDNQQMTASQHYEVSVEQADGAFDLEFGRDRGDSADAFDSTYPNFNDTTNPDAKWWSGSNSGVRISVQSAAGANMNVQFGLPANTIQVNYPNGGESIYFGSTQNISWGANITGNVKIDLYKGGVLHSALSANEANDGSYTWTVSAGLPSGNDYTVRVTSVDNPAYLDSSNANFTIIPQPTIADALDTSGITWTISGNANWFAQGTTTKDGIDAAESGNITHSQSSTMEATITGPGTMTFWWKVSSEGGYDYLRFFLNNVEQTGSLAKIAGEVDWVQKTVTIPAGSQTIKWTYSKDGSVDTGADTAWVDQVVYTPSTAPEIAVEQPVGTGLTDGAASIGCGTVNLGNSSSPVTFTVRNTGTANLSGLSLGKSGTHSVDFTLGSLGATTLAPGASTTFDVTFTPGAAGSRSAAIQITSNDADENPFDISLTGTGVGPGTLAVGPAGNLTSSGNYGGPFSPSSLVYTLSNPGNSSIDWTATKTAGWVTLSSSGGTLAPGANTTVTVSLDANALAVGGYIDTVSFANTTSGSGDTSRGVALTVNPIPATFNFSNLTQTYDGTQKSAIITTNPPGLAHTVTYGGSATEPTNAGSYAIAATITEPNYSGSGSSSLTISKASQTISFAALDPVLDNAAPFSLSATASSNLPVSYGSSNTSVATVSGNTVTIAGLGTSTITASQAGDGNYNAATAVQQTLTVVRANPLAVTGGPYKVLIGQSLSLNGGASLPSYGETLTTHEWDLNNDNDFTDATGATPAAIPFATLTGSWGMVQGLNTIQLKVTDSANKTSTVSTTVELVLSLTWDANGTTAGQTNGAGAWLAANLWWDGAANQTWSSGSNATFGGPNTAGGAVTLASPTSVNAITFNTFTGTYTLGTAGQVLAINGGVTNNSASGVVSIISPVTLGGAQTWSNNSSGSLTFSGAIGGGGGLTKSGTGTVILNPSPDSSDYSGTTIISNGVLNIQKASALGSVADGTSVSSGAALQIQGGITIAAEPVTLDGGGVAASGALRNISGNNNYGGLVTLVGSTRIHSDSGTLTLGNTGTITGAGLALTFGGAGNVTVNSIIGTTTGTVTKEGAGTLTLAGSNTFSGGIILNAGTLATAADGNFGTGGGLTVNGTSTWNAGAGVSLTYNRALTINSGTLSLASGNALKTITGILSGNGSIVNTSTTTFEFNNTANTFTGTLNNGYEMRFNSLGDSTNPINLVGSNSLFTWQGGAKTFASRPFTIQATGTGNINNIGTGALTIQQNLAITGAAGARTLSLGGINTAANTFAGNIADGAGSVVSLTKAGAGTWALAGTNTYSGNTNLPAVLNGRLVFQGSQSLSPNTKLVFTQTSSNVQSVRFLDDGVAPGIISFNRPIDFGGTNTSQVLGIFVGNNNTANLGGSSGTTTGRTIQVGNITHTSTAADTSTWTINVTSPNIYRLEIGTLTLNNLVTRTANNVTTTILNPTTANMTVSAITMAVGNTGTANDGIPVLRLDGTSSDNRVAGIISNASDYLSGQALSVQKQNASTWILTGANTYSGATTISGGILQLGDGSSGKDGTIENTSGITNTATLVFNRFGDVSSNVPISGSGSLTKTGPGSQTLAATNSYTGPTSVNAGKLFINGNQTAATGAVGVSADATLGGTGIIGGNTTIAANGRLEFNLSTAPGSHDKLELAAGRSLTFSGASVLTITSSGGVANGSYTLVTAPGGISGSVPVTLNLPLGWAATVSKVGNDLVLNVTLPDTTPPALTSITDDQSGAPVVTNALVTYTVNFSEDINHSTVTDADFGNAGTAAINIGTVVETTPGVFTVPVTPTSAGTLQLQINAGAVLTDVAGNALITTSTIADDTILTVTPPNTAPVANSQSTGTAEDTALPVTLSATDGESNPLTYTVISGPSNGTLGGSAPNLTYTPATNYSGSDSFTFKASDGLLDSAPATVDITVTPVNDAPVATAQSASTDEDTALPITLAGTDVENSALTFSIVSPPANGTLSGTAPNLTYTPTANTNGSDSFAFTVNDGLLDSVPVNVLITVTQVNDTPVAVAQNATTAEDTALPITLAGTDLDLDTLTYTIVTPPANGTLGGTAPNVTYTPNANTSGADSFTFLVNDGTVNSAAATVSLTVTPANDAPVATAQSVSTAEDTALSITLTGTDAENETLNYTIVTPPASGTLSGTAPYVTYTPAADFNGTASFTFKVSDGTEDSAVAIVSINVTPVNDAPVALAQSAGTAEDTALPITLAGTDADLDTLNFTIVTPPANGSLSGTAPNVTYTPAANTSGSDSFTFTVNDGTVESLPATVSLTVTATNDAPVAVVQSVTTAEDTALPITLSGTDAENGTLTYTLVTPPANGTLSGTAPNVTYTPSANYNAADSFTFTVNDGTVDSEPAAISINVTPVNDTPVAAAQALTTAEDAALPITLAGIDIENSTLTFAIVTPPANGTLGGSAPNLTYTPAANYHGPDSFTFTVNDGLLDSAPATVILTVTPLNDAPIATAQSVTTAEDTAIPIALAGNDVESSTLTYTLVTSPTSGTLSGTAPDLTYTPAANSNGPDGFTFTVNDGLLDSVPVNVVITVTQVNDAPVAVAQSATTAEDTVLSITLAGTDVDLDTLTYTIVTQPANGTLSGIAPNVTYTPNANISGDDSFTFIVNDSTIDSAPTTVTLTVTASNDAPAATAQTVTTAEDNALPITLTGTDAENSTLTYSIVAQPASGTLSGTAPNVTYTPAANYNGSVSFTFKVNDGTLDSATATVSINITSVNDAPVFTVDPIIAAGAIEGVSYTGQTLAGSATDADAGDSITYSKVSGPAWLVVASNGVLSGTPGSGTAGLNTFTVRATDTSAATTDATLQIAVTGLPLPWASGDIGTGMLAGTTTFNSGTFFQAGSGVIGGTADKLRFTYQTITGDGEIIARISALQNTGNSSRVGVMIRDTLATNSKQIFMGLTGSGSYRWTRRTATGGSTSTTNSSSGTIPNTWVRLVRSGSTITAYKSTNGTTWTTVGSTTGTTFGSTCYIGLAVASGSDTTLNTSQFSNLGVTP